MRPWCSERGIVLIAHQIIHYHAAGEEMQHESGMTDPLDIFQCKEIISERMTVNHDVASSSPAGGANKKISFRDLFYWLLWGCLYQRAVLPVVIVVGKY